jgi:hypothetical protein
MAWLNGHFARQQYSMIDVAVGSKADIPNGLSDVLAELPTLVRNKNARLIDWHG